LATSSITLLGFAFAAGDLLLELDGSGTVLEAFGILLPWIWLPVMLLAQGTASMPLGPTVLASFAIAAQLVQRTLLARRFSQPWECVALHPVTVALLLAIQWRSWWLHLTKRRAWRGRTAG
jgi:hypothetical protein